MYNRVVTNGDEIFTSSTIFTCALLKLLNPMITFTRSDKPLQEYLTNPNSYKFGLRGFEYEESRIIRHTGVFYGNAGDAWKGLYNNFYNKNCGESQFLFWQKIDRLVFQPIDCLDNKQFTLLSEPDKEILKIVEIIKSYNLKWVEGEMTNTEAFNEIVTLVSEYLDVVINNVLNQRKEIQE